MDQKDLKTHYDFCSATGLLESVHTYYEVHEPHNIEPSCIRHGEEVSYNTGDHESRIRIKSNWVDGKRHGTQTVYSCESNNISSVSNYKNGELHGEHKDISYIHDASGKITEKSITTKVTYTDGKVTSKITKTHSSGKVLAEYEIGENGCVVDGWLMEDCMEFYDATKSGEACAKDERYRLARVVKTTNGISEHKGFFANGELKYKIESKSDINNTSAWLYAEIYNVDQKTQKILTKPHGFTCANCTKEASDTPK